LGRTEKAQLNLARKVLAKPLFKSIEHIFSQDLFDCMLVGGTAIAGFYAAHRRSDDIDLFVKDEQSFKATIQAVKTLKDIGADLSSESQSKQYYHNICTLNGSHFTIDVVLDPNVFLVGNIEVLKNKVAVADLNTLFKMKIATLVSRCSEKDLYDIKWLLEYFSNTKIDELVRLGQEIDGGVNAENILSSLSSAQINQGACDFSLDKTISKKQIFNEISDFRKKLIIETSNYLRKLPMTALGEFIKKTKKVLK
jgi:predicted nucleotidyltransferase component of viral defense system